MTDGCNKGLAKDGGIAGANQDLYPAPAVVMRF